MSSIDEEILALERRQREGDLSASVKLEALRRRRGDARLLICTVCRDRDPFRGAHDDVVTGARFKDELTGVELVRKGRCWLTRDQRPGWEQWCPLHKQHLWESIQGYDPREREELGEEERAIRDGRDHRFQSSSDHRATRGGDA